MTPPVALRGLVDGMRSQSDSMAFYLHVRTGPVVPVSEDDLFTAEVEDNNGGHAEGEAGARDVARAAAAGEGYLPLPDRREIDEYRMMERCAEGVQDDAASARLLRAIGGRGAFGYFRDTARELGSSGTERTKSSRLPGAKRNGIEYTREAPSRDVSNREDR